MLSARAPRRPPTAVRRGADVLAPLDPGAGGRQHGAALRGRGQRRRLAAAPADPRRPARPPRRRGARRGRRRGRRGRTTRLVRGPGDRPRPDRPAPRPASTSSSSAAPPAATTWWWPARPAATGVDRRRRHRVQPAPRPGQRARLARGALRRRPAPGPPGPTPGSARPTTTARWSSSEPGIVVGAQVPPAGRRHAPTRSTSCSRSTRSRRRWAWSPGRCSPRAACCWS